MNMPSVKTAIEAILLMIGESRKLSSDPDGPYFYIPNEPHRSYLKDLGILGEGIFLSFHEYAGQQNPMTYPGTDRKMNPRKVFPVDFDRAEECLRTLESYRENRVHSINLSQI